MTDRVQSVNYPGKILMNNLTVFEQTVLEMIAKYGTVFPGNKRVHYSLAARRLEKKGYCKKGSSWYVTQKGRDYLSKGIDQC